MKAVSSKRMNRIERKKKKMAALLEISKLNEHDRTKSAHMNGVDVNAVEIEPSPKRLRTEPADSPSLQETLKATETELEIGPSGKEKLHGEELIQLKRLLRENTKTMRATPKFRLRELGETATLNVNMEDRIPLFVSDIQHLILFSQIGNHSPFFPTRWCHLEKYSKLQHTNVLVIENLSLYDYQAHESLFPFLSSTFSHKLEIITPGAYKGDLVQDLATVPLTMTQMRKFIDQYGTLKEAVFKSSELFDRIRDLFPVENSALATESRLPKGDKFPRTQLLLSGWQMVEENFPLPIKGLMETKYAGYALTKDSYKPVTPSSPMFGVDCEMCRTTSGDLELTRVSVVDENYSVFYDELVKPHNKIIDYLTQFSGITARMMRDVTKRLKDVQQDLKRLLPEDAILVGQSLSNDMHALKLMHPYIIDTSVIYNVTGDRMKKTKLQVLAREFLSERIQESRSGHCSTEDSLASLKLTKLKLSKDIHFGDVLMSDVAVHMRHHPELGNPNFATSMLKQTTKLDKNALVVGVDDIATKYHFYTYKEEKPQTQEKKIKCVSKSSNKLVAKQVCESAKEHSLNIGHMRLTAAQLEGDIQTVCKNVDKWVRQFHEATANPGLCIVILGGHRNAGNGCCFITIKSNTRLP